MKSKPEIIKIDNAASIEFINVGDSMVIVEKVAIPPLGSWKPCDDLPNEIDITTYDLSFSPVTGSTNKCVVVTKQYTT